MMNLSINLPLLFTVSGVLTLFYYGYWMQIKTAVIPATVRVTQQFVKEMR